MQAGRSAVLSAGPAEAEGSSGTLLSSQNPNFKMGALRVEQGAFHSQNRNCGEQGRAEQECLGGWEVSGKRKRSSSERGHLRRLQLNAEVRVADNRRNACSRPWRELVIQSI